MSQNDASMREERFYFWRKMSWGSDHDWRLAIHRKKGKRGQTKDNKNPFFLMGFHHHTSPQKTFSQKLTHNSKSFLWIRNISKGCQYGGRMILFLEKNEVVQ